jgi:hypothetical protein
MKKGPSGTSYDLDLSIPGMETCRRHQKGWHLTGSPMEWTVSWTWVLVLVAGLTAPGLAQAQELMLPPSVPHVDSKPYRHHHWWSVLSSNDGIPRTYSYYYSTGLNQPCHYRVVGPDGRTYWTSTVRGLPMGMQWLLP